MFINIDTLLELKLIINRLSDLSGLIDLSRIRTNLTQVNRYIISTKPNSDTTTSYYTTTFHNRRRDTFRWLQLTIVSCIVEEIKMKPKCQLGLIVQMTRDLNLRDTYDKFKHYKSTCWANLKQKYSVNYQISTLNERFWLT